MAIVVARAAGSGTTRPVSFIANDPADFLKAGQSLGGGCGWRTIRRATGSCSSTSWWSTAATPSSGRRRASPSPSSTSTSLKPTPPDAAFKIDAADTYWAKTKDYWAAIRARWDAAIARNRGVKLREEAGDGSVSGFELMLIADDVASGESKLADAITEADGVIDCAASK